MTHYRRKATFQIITTAIQKLIPGAALAGMQVEITEKYGETRNTWSGSVMALAERIHTALYGTTEEAEDQTAPMALDASAEDLLSTTRKHLWTAWSLSSEEMASQAAETLYRLGMLVPEGGAQELERLRARYSGALPKLSPDQRATLAKHIGNALPARDSLLLSLGESIRGRREHEHPTWEDLYCLNLVSYTGERMAPVLRRLLDAEARIAELESAQSVATIHYRASWDSITLGRYTTADAARAHCEARARRDLPTVALDWIEDEEDGIAELVGRVGEEERPLGYTVTALEVASEYDEEAAE
ncbi:hypothetical protein [Streptomyces sp. NPDC004658]|uniref:hypothetical protein n=1 Tax=Streptomyces sp. NPDC004658 TaxID=3154672 RepID=UPI0033B358C1